MNLLKSSGTIAGMTLISRIFGFLRDILLARILGAGMAADAWQLAFQLPNIFRRLFAEGAFSAAFVPLFNRKLSDKDGKKDHASAQSFANEIMSVFVPILILFTAIFEIAMPFVIWLIADDFGGNSTDAQDKFDLSVTLARITFPYLALISVTTLFAGILNSLSRFAAAAAAPILLNLCLIAALLAGYIMDGDVTIQTAYFLAFGVAFAGFLQFLWLYYWVRKSGFQIKLQKPIFSKDVGELGILILPAIFGAGIYQISRFVDLFFVSQLEEGSLTYLAMADRLNQLPLGIIGIALGTAILPALSRFIANEDSDSVQRLQSNAIELAMLITVPAAAALFVAAYPIVTAFYVGGNFASSDGATTAAVVSALVLGLPAYVMVKVLIPGFFARKDTKTPVYTAGISLVINIILNLLLIPRYGVPGLAMAGAIAAWTNCAMLYGMLHIRGHYHLELSLIFRLARIFLSAGIMAIAIHYAIPITGEMFGGTAWERIISISLLVSAGGLIYLILAWITGAIDREKIAMLTKKKLPQEGQS